MDNCPESELLIPWLNGRLDESLTIDVRNHVNQCQDCQNRLEDLTSETSLVPPLDPRTLMDGDSFTNEPHFLNLRENLTAKVLELNAKSRIQSDQDQADLKAIDRDSKYLLLETVAARDEITEPMSANLNGIAGHWETIQIDGYRLEGLIGRGGFADVYRGWEKRLQRPVAIKVLDCKQLDARNRYRFLREAKVASAIDSEHVVRVLTCGETASNRPYIVMELVKGQSLAAWIESQRQNISAETITQGVTLILQICDGLHAVHEAGLVHRDIKPSNIFVDAKKQSAKLGDFGLALVANDDTVTLTRASELAGTPAFMSPEQTLLSTDVTRQSDIYSLGATLYQVLTGQPPFRGSSLAILKQVVDVEPIPPRQLNEAVSKDLETICQKAMAKDSRQRYASATEFANDLQNALNGNPIRAQPIGPLEKLKRWARKNFSLAVSSSLLLLALLVGTTASTMLWLKSEYHVQRATESRSQLMASVRTMVASTLKRKSSYLDMSGDDRTQAVQVVASTYKTMFDSRLENEIDLVRELAGDLAEATEVNLELSAYQRAAELMKTNWYFVDVLTQQPDPTDEDRATAAWFYNQLAEYFLNHESLSDAFQTGQTPWQVKFAADRDEKAKAQECLLKAILLSTGSAKPDSVLGFQHQLASWRLLCLDESSEANKVELERMLENVARIRDQNDNHSPLWMSLHQRMLKHLSRVTEGEESLGYRMKRAEVYKHYLAYLTSNGQETFWYDRDAAVNYFFIGLALLRTGNGDRAKPVLAEAIQQMEKLVAAFPGNSQFQADVAEAYLVVAEVAWQESRFESAMTSYHRTLEAFTASLKNDSGEISIRRRAGVIHQLVGQRHMARKEYAAAADCFSEGARNFLAVFESPYDPDAKDADKAMLESLTHQANEAREASEAVDEF